MKLSAFAGQVWRFWGNSVPTRNYNLLIPKKGYILIFSQVQHFNWVWTQDAQVHQGFFRLDVLSKHLQRLTVTFWIVLYRLGNLVICTKSPVAQAKVAKITTSVVNRTFNHFFRLSNPRDDKVYFTEHKKIYGILVNHLAGIVYQAITSKHFNRLPRCIFKNGFPWD